LLKVLGKRSCQVSVCVIQVSPVLFYFGPSPFGLTSLPPAIQSLLVTLQFIFHVEAQASKFVGGVKGRRSPSEGGIKSPSFSFVKQKSFGQGRVTELPFGLRGPPGWGGVIVTFGFSFPHHSKSRICDISWTLNPTERQSLPGVPPSSSGSPSMSTTPRPTSRSSVDS